MLRVQIASGRKERFSNEISFEPGVVGGGGNSGFQALNLAVQFGPRRIILVGFDLHDQGGLHWYGRNRWPMSNNPDHATFARWRKAFDAAAVTLKVRGIEVFNASPSSALACFPYSRIEDIVPRETIYLDRV